MKMKDSWGPTMSTGLAEIRRPIKPARRAFGGVPSDGTWDTASTPETKIHRIHPYPAKFPAFLTHMALEYARSEKIKISSVADVFCGCGTVAYEAKAEGLDFWGCDINPVAVLIAKTKSSNFDPRRLAFYSQKITNLWTSASEDPALSAAANDRLRHWFSENQYCHLAKLLNSIKESVPVKSIYRTAFLCAFSAILKSCSQWRQRSTKPALDKDKVPANVLEAFEKQCRLMISAWSEASLCNSSSIKIECANLLTAAAPSSPVDIIITSPPYVTSYEYADLHQLSSLWLGYADDHRELRTGSIGSTQHNLDFRREYKRLNETGMELVFSLYDHDRSTARSVANYLIDMQDVARRCFQLVRPGGLAVFVIGNTEYHGVSIDNASHLAESLFHSGFKRIRATRRNITNKKHTPFRDIEGRFSQFASNKNIYSEEYILIAHR